MGDVSPEVMEAAKAAMLDENMDFSEPTPPSARSGAGYPSLGGYIDTHFNFATCQRSDGSYYGTGGTCKKGTPVSGVPKKEKKMADMRAKDLKRRGASGENHGKQVKGGDAASRKANNVATAKKAEKAAGAAVTKAEGKRDQAQAAASSARQAVKQAESKVKSAAGDVKDIKKFGNAATDGNKKYKQGGDPAERKAENLKRAEKALQKAKMDVVKAENRRDQLEARENSSVQAVKQAESALRSARQERKDIEKFGDAATDGLSKYEQP